MNHFQLETEPRQNLSNGRFFVILAVALFLLFQLLVIRPIFAAQELEENTPKLLAVVTSDLHYARNGTALDTIVAGMAYADEIIDALLAEVVALHPDVFILTGDNTNGGDKEDMAVLAGKLEAVRDAGIQIIMTTGNHDFDKSTPAEFEECYASLPEPADRDPASLSYTAISGKFVFLAMDDSTFSSDRHGLFSDETMSWLEKMCRKYSGKELIFLSHHNVLAGNGDEASWSYRIQNDGLPELLRRYGVRLCLTGHLHSQMILSDQGLYEIISGMPYSGNHLIGMLEDTGSGLDYHAERIDFEKYGDPAFAESMADSEAQKGAQLRTSIGNLLEADGYTGDVKEGILDLFSDFFEQYQAGTIGAAAEAIKASLYCEEMLKALWGKNYGPWMASVLEDPPADATWLFIPKV